MDTDYFALCLACHHATVVSCPPMWMIAQWVEWGIDWLEENLARL
jgi:hypothetical protein